MNLRPQFHLSTGIILMFAAGGIMWLNIRERAIDLTNRTWSRVSESYGWPYDVTRRDYHLVQTGQPYQEVTVQKLNKDALVSNIRVGVGVLIVIWIVCELWIVVGSRRR